MARLLVHDVVKIKLSEEGYLPYYPYHLISDEEMMNAFVLGENTYFDDYYPLPCEGLSEEYEALKSYVSECCEKYLNDTSYLVPDWVYSYMLGAVVGPQSEQKDVHDLLVLLNLDNLYDEFNDRIYKSLYQVSKSALGSASDLSRSDESEYRPATMFGEPHIVKYLRLEQVSVG